jgi:hypothetical protein
MNEGALNLALFHHQIKVEASHFGQEPAGFAGEYLAVLERHPHALGADGRRDAGFLHFLEFPRQELHGTQQLQLLDPVDLQRLDRSQSGSHEIERPLLGQKAMSLPGICWPSLPTSTQPRGRFASCASAYW